MEVRNIASLCDQNTRVRNDPATRPEVKSALKRLICETAQNKFETSRDQSSTAKMARDNDEYVEKSNETLRTKNESKRMSVAMFHDVDVKTEARDNKRLTSTDNDNQKGGDKPKRRGNHNQGGNRNNFFRGHASRRNKAVLTLDPAPEPTNTTSVKILDDMDNMAKEKLPNFRDDNRGALLVELCEKSIAICEAYDLYNDNGDWKIVAQAQYRALYGEYKNTWQELMNNTRNYGTNGTNKHKRICQQLC